MFWKCGIVQIFGNENKSKHDSEGDKRRLNLLPFSPVPFVFSSAVQKHKN
jgi:hypothetical protein